MESLWTRSATTDSLLAVPVPGRPELHTPDANVQIVLRSR